MSNVEEYRNKHIITIVFNKEMLESFDCADAKKRKGRKKQVLDWCGKSRLGLLPMLNRFLNVSSRMQQNTMKQQMSDYTKHILSLNGIENNEIKRCMVLVKQFNKTNREFDLDGVSVKAPFDALSDYKVWIDDNYKVLEPLVFTGGYDKENPRSEIIIYEITNEYPREFVLDIMMNDLKGGK